MTRKKGQIVPLFALILTVLMGFSALVIDIGTKYSFERRYQSLTDAASLAGAQELQPTTRTSPVTAQMRQNARTQALRIVLNDLEGATSDPACDPAPGVDANVDCTIQAGRFHILVKTPSPYCVDCAVDRAVFVRVEEPQFNTTFARIFGQSNWDLYRTSVAGLDFGKAYTIVTLRPPQPLGGSSGFDVRDFRIEGNSTVGVSTGDVGTNSNMEYGGINNRLYLDAGYTMNYFDPYHGPDWTPPSPADPIGHKLGAMIRDPGYVIPGRPATAGSVLAGTSSSECQTAAATLVAATSTYAPYLPTSSPGVPDMRNITCLLPGYFAANPLRGDNNAVILLTDPQQHGLYYFGAGLTVQSSLVGGYAAGSPGVAVVVPQNQELNMNTNGAGQTAFALNAGSKFLSGSGTEALPALDFNGSAITTNGTPAIKLSLMVTRDPNCAVAFPYPASCSDTSNDAIKISGNSAIYLAGVQFMPTDNASINSSAATGYVGQIWAWTLKYSGGVRINQQGSSALSAGVIRIDTACSPGAASCP